MLLVAVAVRGRLVQLLGRAVRRHRQPLLKDVEQLLLHRVMLAAVRRLVLDGRCRLELARSRQLHQRFPPVTRLTSPVALPALVSVPMLRLQQLLQQVV